MTRSADRHPKPALSATIWDMVAVTVGRAPAKTFAKWGDVMIIRRYGAAWHSVVPNFNPAAMTEIGFRRDHSLSIRAAALAEDYRLAAEAEVAAEADAPVQRDAELAVLANMERALGARVAALGPGELLAVLNERGAWPKTRERREGVIVEGENRFRFHWWVEPPLRVAVYAKKGSP